MGKNLKVAPSTAPSTLACPGGMTTAVARPALFTIPPAPGASGGGDAIRLPKAA